MLTLPHLALIFIVNKSKRLGSLQEMCAIESGVGTVSSLEDLLKFMMPCKDSSLPLLPGLEKLICQPN